jgi:aldehyde:ferredoxin oxidoreductase
LGMKHYDRLGGAEKAGNVAIHQDWRSVFNALVMCIFANIDPSLLLELVNAACGLDWRMPDLLLCGERAWNLKRMLNHRLGLNAGLGALAESWPKALRVAFPDAPPGMMGNRVPDIETMLRAYYAARGWNPDTGMPTPEKLAELGLGWLQEGET